MGKSLLPCPKCLKQVVYNRLVPHYENENSPITIINKKLSHYTYKCSYCGVESVFYKDAVREIWQEQNPDKKAIPKL